MQRFRATPRVGRGRSIVIGPSSSESYVLLGRLSEVGPEREVRLDVEREHVVAVLGKRGSGKTHTLGVLLEGLGIADRTHTIGRVASDRAVLLFDTMNLFQWIGIPLATAGGPISQVQFEKARAWNLPEGTLSPSFWHLAGSRVANHESKPLKVAVADIAPQDWGLLMDVDVVAEPMGQLMAAAHDKVTRTGWRKKGKRIGARSVHSIADLVECIGDDVDLASDFATETRRAVRQRLNSYDRTGLFSTEGTHLEEIVQPGRVAVISLGNVGEDLRTMVAFLLVRKVLEQRALASEATKNALITGLSTDGPSIPRTWIIVDEAQNIIPDRTASLANKELTRFVREGRNFGLSIAISTQQPTAIDNKVMAQVDVLVAHTLTVQNDTNYVHANLKCSLPRSLQLGRRDVSLPEALRDLEVGQCLVSAVDVSRAIFVEMRPRVTAHGGFEA